MPQTPYHIAMVWGLGFGVWGMCIDIRPSLRRCVNHIFMTAACSSGDTAGEIVLKFVLRCVVA